MVYIISVSSYTNEVWGDFEEERLIKIGYTNEPDGKTRFGAYRNSTRIKIFKVIEEGTEDDEKRLHQYFSKYRVKGKEWYRFDEDILDFFRTYTTIEEIRTQLPLLPIEEKFTVEEIERIKCLFNPILYYMINHNSIRLVGGDEYITIDQVHNTLLDKNILDLNSFYEFLRTNYDPVKVEEAIKWYEGFYLVQDLTKELEEFWALTQYINKMEYVCQAMDKLGEEKFNLFLNSIPWSFKKYYVKLGPVKCKAMAYKKGELEKEYQRQLNNQGVSMDDRIYDTFHVGERWKKSEIKEKLGKIYKDSGYEGTAKAVDIERWFTTRPTQFLNKETGKRDAGYMIVSKKV